MGSFRDSGWVLTIYQKCPKNPVKKKKKSETRFLVFPAENVRNIGFSGFSGNNVSDGYLTIYMGKPEVPVVKSNFSRHSVWYASENMSCDLRRAARDAIQSVFFTF